MRYELPVETNADSAVLDSLVGMLRAGGGYGHSSIDPGGSDALPWHRSGRAHHIRGSHIPDRAALQVRNTDYTLPILDAHRDQRIVPIQLFSVRRIDPHLFKISVLAIKRHDHRGILAATGRISLDRHCPEW